MIALACAAALALQLAPKAAEVVRPRDPWVFEEPLDGRPRLVTVALADALWVAYDPATCGLHRAWKGDVGDGRTRGASYVEGYPPDQPLWEVTYRKGPDVVREPVRAVWKGTRLHGTRKVALLYDLELPKGRVVRVEESPEFVRPMDRFNEQQIESIGVPSTHPGLVRTFRVIDPPDEVKLTLRLQTGGARFRQSLGLERESFEDLERPDGSVATRIHSHLVLGQGRELNYLLMIFDPPAEPAPEASPAGGGLPADEAAAGFTPLFDGRTLAGWRGYGRTDVPAGWIVEDGCIVRDGPAGDLVTDGEYGDFELRLEWKISEGGNSGIFFHVQDGHDAVWRTGPEMQVLDNERHADGKNPLTSAGANYALHAPARDATRPVGEFNAVRLRVEKGRVTHWLNGVELLSYELGSPAWQALVQGSKFADVPHYGRAERGRIALQDHGDRVWYRNLRVLRLDGR